MISHLFNCACLAIRFAVFVFRGMLLHEPSAVLEFLFNCEFESAVVLESSSDKLSSVWILKIKYVNFIIDCSSYEKKRSAIC
jgi:hypothetical protein